MPCQGVQSPLNLHSEFSVSRCSFAVLATHLRLHIPSTCSSHVHNLNKITACLIEDIVLCSLCVHACTTAKRILCKMLMLHVYTVGSEISYALPEIRYQISVSHLKNGCVLVMRMRNTNQANEHVFGAGGMGRISIYYACAVPLEHALLS